VETFDSDDEFRQKLARQLAQLVNERFARPAESGLVEPGRAMEQVAERLSPEAKAMLIEGASDPSGTICRFPAMDGISFGANRKQFGQPGNPRSEATWEAALQQLVEYGCIEDVGYKREIFRVTAHGYTVADGLRG
jgi:hypothetical protein